MNERESAYPVPSSNWAVAILRGVLWFLPAGFAILSLIVVIPFSQLLGFDYIGTFAIWVILSIAFTMATGWFYALLSKSDLTEEECMWSRRVKFFIIQLILVPLLIAVAVIALWTTNPPKFFCVINPSIF